MDVNVKNVAKYSPYQIGGTTAGHVGLFSVNLASHIEILSFALKVEHPAETFLWEELAISRVSNFLACAFDVTH